MRIRIRWLLLIPLCALALTACGDNWALQTNNEGGVGSGTTTGTGGGTFTGTFSRFEPTYDDTW